MPIAYVCRLLDIVELLARCSGVSRAWDIFCLRQALQYRDLTELSLISAGIPNYRKFFILCETPTPLFMVFMWFFDVFDLCFQHFLRKFEQYFLLSLLFLAHWNEIREFFGLLWPSANSSQSTQFNLCLFDLLEEAKINIWYEKMCKFNTSRYILPVT